jgi:hypothetical protein
MLSDDAGGGGRREDSVASDQNPGYAVRRRQLQDRLDRLAIMEPTVAAEDARAAAEGWKGGRLEGWKAGRLEGWKAGRLSKMAWTTFSR